MPKKTTKTSKTTSRDSRGRFLAGNSISQGHGRPRKEQEQAYLLAFQKGLSDNDLTAVVESLVTQAKGGSVAAARLLIENCLGRPATRIEWGAESGEYRVAGRTPAAHMGEMWDRIQAKVQKRRRYEARLSASGVQLEPNSQSKKRS